MTIGSYQLQNLINARSQFHYFNLSEPPQDRDSSPLLSRFLVGSRLIVGAAVLEELHALGVASDAPIVLICENGLKSVAVATVLAQNSFINVFVVENGIAGLI